MKMDLKCPHCGEWIEDYGTPMTGWFDDDTLFMDYDTVCNKCHEHVYIMEELRVTARYVGKDKEDCQDIMDREDGLKV